MVRRGSTVRVRQRALQKARESGFCNKIGLRLIHDCHDGARRGSNRIRELIASEDGYTEQKMFGSIGFMIDGHMALGVSGEGGLMIHCSREETEALLAKPGARPF